MLLQRATTGTADGLMLLLWNFGNTRIMQLKSDIFFFFFLGSSAETTMFPQGTTWMEIESRPCIINSEECNSPSTIHVVNNFLKWNNKPFKSKQTLRKNHCSWTGMYSLVWILCFLSDDQLQLIAMLCFKRLLLSLLFH